MGASLGRAGRIIKQLVSETTQAIVSVCRDFYQADEPIELYRPSFDQSEVQALSDVLASGWVAMGGAPVAQFEQTLAAFIGVEHAVATIHATAALHLSLECLGVGPDDLVITQANTFIAPVNAIRYVGAMPYFIDVDQDTMGMSAKALAAFIETECEHRDGGLHYRATGQRIGACLPVHVLGLPCRIQAIRALCDEVGLPLIEDAAEALGSAVKEDRAIQRCGSFGDVGVVSFNANKLITTGSGGVLLTNDHALADRARHLSRVAKQPHAYEAKFDKVGYNYGMPALNASLGLAQWQKLGEIQASKRALAEQYQSALTPMKGVKFIEPVEQAISNDWIMALVFDQPDQAHAFIQSTHRLGVLTRPLWQPLNQSLAHEQSPRSALPNTEWLYGRVVQLPSWPMLASAESL